jgi:hypothetical protein
MMMTPLVYSMTMPSYGKYEGPLTEFHLVVHLDEEKVWIWFRLGIYTQMGVGNTTHYFDNHLWNNKSTVPM